MKSKKMEAVEIVIKMKSDWNMNRILEKVKEIKKENPYTKIRIEVNC